MNITLEIDGGFAPVPALQGPFVVDTALVEPTLAAEIERLTAQARFFDYPAAAPDNTRAADFKSYTLTINDGTRRHSIRITDPIADSNLAKLVAHIRSMARPPRP